MSFTSIKCKVNNEKFSDQSMSVKREQYNRIIPNFFDKHNVYES